MFRRNDTNSTQSLPENRKGTLSDLFYEASIKTYQNYTNTV